MHDFAQLPHCFALSHPRHFGHFVRVHRQATVWTIPGPNVCGFSQIVIHFAWQSERRVYFYFCLGVVILFDTPSIKSWLLGNCLLSYACIWFHDNGSAVADVCQLRANCHVRAAALAKLTMGTPFSVCFDGDLVQNKSRRSTNSGTPPVWASPRHRDSNLPLFAELPFFEFEIRNSGPSQNVNRPWTILSRHVTDDEPKGSKPVWRLWLDWIFVRSVWVVDMRGLLLVVNRSLSKQSILQLCWQLPHCHAFSRFCCIWV